MPRDYERERQLYYGYGPASGVTAEQRRHRRENAARKVARAKVKASGTAVRGKDVHHKNGNPTDNRRSNLQVTSRAYNRAKNKH